jgi:hypothetical protein
VPHDPHLTHGRIRLRPLTPDDAPRLRAFRRAADGTVADADHVSVTAAEWPAVRAGLAARLGG